MDIFKRNDVKYGLLMDLLLAACLMWMFFTNDYSKMQTPTVEGLLISFGLPLIAYGLGLWAKKKELKGKMSWKQGVMAGFRISLVVALTSPFVFLLFYIFFNPGLVDYAKTAYQLPASTSREVVILIDMIVQFVGSIIGGVIYSAIIAFFLKSKP